MKAQHGQVALYLVLVLVAITFLTLMNVGAYLSVTAKNRTMNAGDAAALAVARHQAELLNRIGALNVDHLKAALADDEEACARLAEEQARLCFLGPLRGISLGNAAAQANGAEPSDEMREILEQHVIDIRTTYVTTPEAYPAPWEGAWEEYAQALEVEIGAPLYAGPDNIEFMDAAGGHLLLNAQFYHAVAGRNWCWFHFYAPGVLDCYSGFGDWGPLPRADDALRRQRCANSEVYSLHLVPRTGSAVDLLGPALVCRLADASLDDLAQSSLITNQNQVWFFYDTTEAGLWRRWWEIDPDGDDRFPVVGPVKPEYDVRGAAAICRVLGDIPNLLESDEDRVAKWAAAAKPFGTVEAADGGVGVVTALKGFVTSAFEAVRLVPLDAVGGKDLSTADPDWMRHLREDLPAYFQNGPDALKGCYYCRQLVDWEKPSVREQGRTWLKYNASSCLRPTGGSGGRGGTPHGH